MIDETLFEAEEKMEKAVSVARDDFSGIRTGRANPAMFNKMTVDYYGSDTPIQQLASFATPEARGGLGIEMLPGGQGTWPSMSIADNLQMGAFRYRRDPADVQRRIDRVLDLYPALGERLTTRAGDLSGGQQQMLALARVMLHEPDVLIIDELSLGLAPTVVQDLLGHIDRLRERGQTMVIVEQSLNVALAIADRAVFLEKGQVRFEGPAHELAERDDLARAVFLGTEGG